MRQVPPLHQSPRPVGRRGRRPRAPVLPLEDALELVYLYAEHDRPKYEPAALRWLGRYLAEQQPSLVDYATVAANLAQRRKA
jgi:hypothetical protein